MDEAMSIEISSIIAYVDNSGVSGILSINLSYIFFYVHIISANIDLY